MSILVALGDDVDARLTAYLLGGLDPDIVVTQTVAEAEQLLAQRPWRAVLLDTVLSDGNCFGLLRTLDHMSFDGGVLVVSAAHSVQTKVRALDAGADDYVVRPYDPAELVARVKAALRKSRRRAARADVGMVRVGNVELDLNALEIRLPGAPPRRLTPNEMRLTHYLISCAPRVVGYEELATRVFGGREGPVTDNAIGVYVRRVRRKIEPDSSHPRYILTVRGSGYRFAAVPAAVELTTGLG